MFVYRLGKTAYIHDLSGKGAETYGGRWNSKGTALIYASGSRSLCAFEILVHIGATDDLPEDLSVIEIEIPDDIQIHYMDAAALPKGWNAPIGIYETQLIGNNFVSTHKTAVLAVPSAIIPQEYNFLLNPRHSDFHKIKITATETFGFDQRLLKRQ